MSKTKPKPKAEADSEQELFDESGPAKGQESAAEADSEQ